MATYRRNKGGITYHLLSRFFIQFQIASGGRKAGKERGIFARSKGERERRSFGKLKMTETGGLQIRLSKDTERRQRKENPAVYPKGQDQITLLFNFLKLSIMGVPFKKIPRKDPRKADAVAKIYPQLVTLGPNADLEDVAYVMKEKSSLTLGDIKSVITNFVEALMSKLYSGQSVNIKDFGVFSLSARTVGVEKVEDCTAKNIKAVKINFRPSTTIRPDVTATRAGQKIDFYDLEALVNKDGNSSGGSSSGDQGGSGSGGGVDENPLG